MEGSVRFKANLIQHLLRVCRGDTEADTSFDERRRWIAHHHDAHAALQHLTTEDSVIHIEVANITWQMASFHL